MFLFENTQISHKTQFLSSFSPLLAIRSFPKVLMTNQVKPIQFIDPQRGPTILAIHMERKVPFHDFRIRSRNKLINQGVPDRSNSYVMPQNPMNRKDFRVLISLHSSSFFLYSRSFIAEYYKRVLNFVSLFTIKFLHLLGSLSFIIVTETNF